MEREGGGGGAEGCTLYNNSSKLLKDLLRYYEEWIITLRVIEHRA